MPIQRFKIEDVDAELIQIVQQSQVQNQKQPNNIVQSLLEKARAKRIAK